MKTLLAILLLYSTAFAQSITPAPGAPSVTAGGSTTVSLAFVAGTTAVAATQWSMTPGTGVTISNWTAGAAATAAGKALTCFGTATITCIVAGLNTTAIASGTIASYTVTLAATLRGAQPLSLTATLSSDPTGAAVATSGGTGGLTAMSPFDLNLDGLVNGTDLNLAIKQADGSSDCALADFNGDGKCNVLDLILLVVDSQLPIP